MIDQLAEKVPAVGRHGFMHPLNARRFYAAAEAFLAEHLGGRAEPARPDEDIEPFLR